MKISSGVDIIEIERIRDSIVSTDGRFCERVYTEKEIEYCENKKRQKYQHYAARFAAKEAIFKAISSNLQSKYEISWQDIEILNNDTGRPYVNLRHKQINEIECIDLSISHCKQYAIANAVILYK